MDVKLKDFKPINEWQENQDPNERRYNNGRVMYVIDTTTNRKYLNESKGCVRLKCTALTAATPIVHAVACVANTIFRLVRIFSFYHFWADKQEKTYSFLDRLKDCGQDCLRVILTPIAYAGLELAAIYGIMSPYNGRKLYASIERAYYGGPILAPCFQPSSKRYISISHLCNGNIDDQGAW